VVTTGEMNLPKMLLFSILASCNRARFRKWGCALRLCWLVGMGSGMGGIASVG
jgi:hypothetical protein